MQVVVGKEIPHLCKFLKYLVKYVHVMLILTPFTCSALNVRSSTLLYNHPGRQTEYVTVHVERDDKSAIIILKYGGVWQNQRILCFSIFFTQGMQKAL